MLIRRFRNQIEMVLCLNSTMSDFGYYEKFTRLNAVYNQRKDATYRSERRCIMRKLFVSIMTMTNFCLASLKKQFVS